MQKRQIYRNRKQTSGFLGSGRWKERSVANEAGGSFRGDGEVENEAVVTVAQLCNLLNIIGLSVLITGDF